MAIFTSAERQTKLTQLKAIINILNEMEGFLRVYDEAEAASWKIKIIPAVEKTLSSNDQIAFQGKWDTLLTDLKTKITAI